MLTKFDFLSYAHIQLENTIAAMVCSVERTTAGGIAPVATDLS